MFVVIAAPPFISFTFRRVPLCKLTVPIVGDAAPMFLLLMSRVPPLMFIAVVSTPAPPLRTKLPVKVNVPPVRVIVEVIVRPVEAFAILTAVPLPVPMVTFPPVMLSRLVMAPATVLEFTAIFKVPIVVEWVPPNAPSPRLIVELAPPVPAVVLERVAMLIGVVTAKVPSLKEKFTIAPPTPAVRLAMVSVLMRTLHHVR